MNYDYQSTEGLIKALEDKRSDKSAEFYKWFMDSIEITEDNHVKELPHPKEAPVPESVARELILAIIFGSDLEHEYPRTED